MSVSGSSPVAPGAHGRTTPHPLFPRRFHSSPRDRFRCIPEHETRLHHSLPRRLTNPARDRCRPETSRCPDRLPCGAAHLDSDPDAPPALALRHSWGRLIAGSHTLGFRPAEVLSSCRGSFLHVSWKVPLLSQTGLRPGKAELLRRP